MWEAFCTRASGVFDIQDATGEPWTSRHRVTNPPENKAAAISAFLSMEKVSRICTNHGLPFDNRRCGYSQASLYEERKKVKIRTSLGNAWQEEFEQPGMLAEEIEARCVDLAAQISDQDYTLKDLRKIVAEKEPLHFEASRALSDKKHLRERLRIALFTTV
ncbi:hypothetical protein BGZ72_002261 [Mortierella alpina]|nr:hypothetical protein BGZ72_002261 [Mortierella alpina]